MNPEPDIVEGVTPELVEAEVQQSENTAEPGAVEEDPVRDNVESLEDDAPFYGWEAEPGVVEEAPVRNSIETLEDDAPFFGWEDIIPRRRSARTPKPTEKMKQLKGLDQALIGKLYCWSWYIGWC